MGSVFGCALGFDEGALVGTELVFEHHRCFQKFQVVAVEDQAGQLGMRLDNLANPDVESDRQIAPREDGSAEDGVLVGMGRSVGGNAEFGADDDVGAAVFSLKQVEFTVYPEVGSAGLWLVAIFVGGDAGVDAEAASLAEGWDRGQQR